MKRLGMILIGLAWWVNGFADDLEPLHDSSVEDLTDIREPFRRMDAPKEVVPAPTNGDSAPAKLEVTKAAPGATPLEQYPTDSFRFVGIMTGPAKTQALLVDPDGKTHFVSKGSKIGIRGGTIVTLSATSIRVREKIVNSSGGAQNTITEIKMPPLR